MPEKDNNTSKYFGPYKDKKYMLNKQDIEKNHRNLIKKSWEIGICAKNSLLGHTF